MGFGPCRRNRCPINAFHVLAGHLDCRMGTCGNDHRATRTCSWIGCIYGWCLCLVRHISLSRHPSLCRDVFDVCGFASAALIALPGASVSLAPSRVALGTRDFCETLGMVVGHRRSSCSAGDEMASRALAKAALVAIDYHPALVGTGLVVDRKPDLSHGLPRLGGLIGPTRAKHACKAIFHRMLIRSNPVV